MKLFRNKDESEAVDERTELEKKFEEAGRKAGRTTGKAAQKGMSSIQNIVSSIEESGTIEKAREATKKMKNVTEETLNKVDKKVKDAINSVTQKNQEEDE